MCNLFISITLKHVLDFIGAKKCVLNVFLCLKIYETGSY